MPWGYLLLKRVRKKVNALKNKRQAESYIYTKKGMEDLWYQELSKKLTNTNCQILGLFVWILHYWEHFLFSLSSCSSWLEQEPHTSAWWRVGRGVEAEWRWSPGKSLQRLQALLREAGLSEELEEKPPQKPIWLRELRRLLGGRWLKGRGRKTDKPNPGRKPGSVEGRRPGSVHHSAGHVCASQPALWE